MDQRTRLEDLERLAHTYFRAKHEAREGSLAHARLLIRHSGNAIRAVHRREWVAATELLARARAVLRLLAETPGGAAQP